MSRYLVPAPTGTTQAGGLPDAPPGTPWPLCKACRGPMQFLARVPLAEAGGPFAGSDRNLLIFQCANAPGLCNEWEPGAGGNAALVVSRSGSVPIAPPAPGADKRENPSVLPEVALAAVDAEPPDGWLGRLGGEPDWLQADETPACRCGRPMRFVVSFEEYVTRDVNFGGRGVGYAFACTECPAEARWFYQC